VTALSACETVLARPRQLGDNTLQLYPFAIECQAHGNERPAWAPDNHSDSAEGVRPPRRCPAKCLRSFSANGARHPSPGQNVKRVSARSSRRPGYFADKRARAESPPHVRLVDQTAFPAGAPQHPFRLRRRRPPARQVPGHVPVIVDL